MKNHIYFRWSTLLNKWFSSLGIAEIFCCFLFLKSCCNRQTIIHHLEAAKLVWGCNKISSKIKVKLLYSSGNKSSKKTVNVKYNWKFVCYSLPPSGFHAMDATNSHWGGYNTCLSAQLQAIVGHSTDCYIISVEHSRIGKCGGEPLWNSSSNIPSIWLKLHISFP